MQRHHIEQILRIRERHSKVLEGLNKKQEMLVGFKSQMVELQEELETLKDSTVSVQSRERDLNQKLLKFDRLITAIEGHIKPLLNDYEQLKKDAQTLYDVIMMDNRDMTEEQLRDEVAKAIFGA